MRVLMLLITLTGCTTISFRTGMAVVGGKPAFQASIEIGPSIMRTHHGISATHEYGVAADQSGAKALAAFNLDHTVIDPDVGPVAKVGVRFRATMKSQGEELVDQTHALLVHAAAYTGLARDAKDKSGGFGIEIGGGVASAAMRTAVDGTRYGKQTSIFEANIVVHGHGHM